MRFARQSLCDGRECMKFPTKNKEYLNERKKTFATRTRETRHKHTGKELKGEEMKRYGRWRWSKVTGKKTTLWSPDSVTRVFTSLRPQLSARTFALAYLPFLIHSSSGIFAGCEAQKLAGSFSDTFEDSNHEDAMTRSSLSAPLARCLFVSSTSRLVTTAVFILLASRKSCYFSYQPLSFILFPTEQCQTFYVSCRSKFTSTFFSIIEQNFHKRSQHKGVNFLNRLSNNSPVCKFLRNRWLIWC